MQNEIIIKKLFEIYDKFEWWHKTKLDEESANKYHKHLIESGNIITVVSDEMLLGYCEFWRINYEQFGRIICGEGFSAIQENVTNGYIAYVANTFVQPEARKKEVLKMLRDRFFEVNKCCLYFVGEARRKSTAPVKVFKNRHIERV